MKLLRKLSDYTWIKLWGICASLSIASTPLNFSALNITIAPSPVTERVFWATSAEKFLEQNPYFYLESQSPEVTILRSRLPFYWLDHPVREARIYYRKGVAHKFLVTFYTKGEWNLTEEQQSDLQKK